ncbi:MAG: T9SS type A sorting domain-containing protein [Bacteroidales bacterium]|nr:T9SS type A sorting domain-containing protein [Bacteroidales bacterium]
MKRMIILSVLVFAISLAKAQYISEIIEYTPAPGQFINISPGLPWNAESIKGSPEKNGRMVSLGFWGGYIIVGFDEPIENDPNNPYGVDFTVFGNAFDGSSEPGIVQVMKDENENGLPDDTWYELMGSDHHLSATTYNYAITYTNPNGKYDVPWVDNEGNEGIVRYMKEFHTQEHYPSADSFPNINQESYTLYGTLLKHKSTQSVKDGLWVNLSFDYGYADNKSIINNRHIEDWFLTPDNPYTLDVLEGCGGDAFDIHWAIDADGNHVDLDKIHWVKVYNGVAQNAGWLGENSTEISGIADVKPDASIQGTVHTIVGNQPPHPGGFPVAANLVCYTGEDFQFESYVVNMGRKRYPDMPANHKITWESSDESLATISENGLLSPQDVGMVTITAKWEDPNDPLAVVGIDSIIVDSIVGRGGTTYLWETFFTGIFREYKINIEVGGVDAIVANNTIRDVVGKPGDSFTYDLEGLFTDPNDPDAAFIYMIFGGHDMSIADAEIVDGKITFELKSVGDIGIIIKCQTNGKMGQTTIPVSVRDDEPTSIVTNSSSDKEYAIYPNPANNFINIKKAERVNIEVFNISGTKVGELNNYSYGQSIYVGHLNSGIYLITINSGTDIKTLKFQKR